MFTPTQIESFRLSYTDLVLQGEITPVDIVNESVVEVAHSTRARSELVSAIVQFDCFNRANACEQAFSDLDHARIADEVCAGLVSGTVSEGWAVSIALTISQAIAASALEEIETLLPPGALFNLMRKHSNRFQELLAQFELDCADTVNDLRYAHVLADADGISR